MKVLQRDDPERPNFVYLDATVERKNKIKISDVFITGNEKVRDSKLKGAMKKTKEKSLRNFFKSAKYIQESYEDDKYNLLDKYNELGYRDAAIIADSVVQESPKRVKIYIDVEEGNKYYYNNYGYNQSDGNNKPTHSMNSVFYLPARAPGKKH